MFEYQFFKTNRIRVVYTMEVYRSRIQKKKKHLNDFNYYKKICTRINKN